MNIRLITKGFFLITRVGIISLCLALPWTGALSPRDCFGLDAAEMAAGADQPDVEFNVTEKSSATEAARESSNTLTITTYAGSGEGHLITFPDSTTMSIDCANGSITTKSHFHSDHCAACDSGQYNRNNVVPGQFIYSKDGVTVQCVAANKKVIGEGAVYVACPASDENAVSMALLVKYRGFDYLTAGDLTASPEGSLGSALAARGVHVDVLKVSHHGSSSSSRLSYLQNISPEYAVVSGTATEPAEETLSNLVSAGVRTIYYANDYSLEVPQVYRANGNIVITTDGRTYSFSGGNPSFSHGPFQVDEYVPPDVIPPHLLVTEVAIGTHQAPETHDWIELYLPPNASSIKLNDLYWTDLDAVQHAATSTVTIMPGDVVILHDTPGVSENDISGKGPNNWWDIYVDNSAGATWNTFDDEFVICSQNSAKPAPESIIDAVVWSNYGGSMYQSDADDGNYLIKASQWGDPTAGTGTFTTTNEGPAIGPITDGYAQRITTIDTNSKGDWQISPTNSEGTPPPEPTPLPTPPPTLAPIEVILNSSSLAAGEMLTVSVVVQPITGRQFDAYAVIAGKAGTFSIQSGNHLRRGVLPIVRNVRALRNGYSGVLLKMAIPKGVSGDYRVIAGLVDAGGKVRGPGSAFAYDVEHLTVK
jgi:hypothetical protein